MIVRAGLTPDKALAARVGTVRPSTRLPATGRELVITRDLQANGGINADVIARICLAPDESADTGVRPLLLR